KDSEFTWKDLQVKNNNELAAILGNFINRTIVFAKTKFDNRVPPVKELTEADNAILNYLKEQSELLAGYYDNFKFKDALVETMNCIRAANKYFNDTEPWKLYKDDKDKCAAVINTCIQICHSIAILINPFLPFTSEKILKILNEDRSNLKWNRIGDTILKEGSELGENEILFPQIEDAQINAEIENDKKLAEVSEDKTMKNVISLDDFKKVNLKVAKVLECEIVPKSKKLLKLKLKVGEVEKQIVSGISEHYKPEDLIGKLIVVVDNLKPSKLMGIDSEGMLLAAKQNGELKIVTIDGEIDAGAEVS
ncbi:MAG: methionine--tRNA ligase subunit beta, partial [Ignavibacteria bacterium]